MALIYSPSDKKAQKAARAHNDMREELGIYAAFAIVVSVVVTFAAARYFDLSKASFISLLCTFLGTFIATRIAIAITHAKTVRSLKEKQRLASLSEEQLVEYKQWVKDGVSREDLLAYYCSPVMRRKF